MSRLIFPAFALVVAGYLAAEQFFGNYRQMGSYFMYILALPIILLAVSQIFADIRAIRQERAAVDGDQAQAGEEGPLSDPALGWNADATRVAVFLTTTIVAFLLLPFLGYLISFGLFLVGAFLLMGVRHPLTVFLLTAGTLIFVHLVFVEYLETRLPAGILKGLI